LKYLVVVVAVVATVGCSSKRRIYVVMESTAPGEVVIEYANPACPPLPSMLAGVEIRIPRSGYLYTSTPINTGWSYSTYAMEGQNGSKPLELEKEIFNHSTFKYGNDACSMVGETFFFLPKGEKVKTGADMGKLFPLHHDCDPSIHAKSGA
jgi:hypothetical protein